MKKVIAISVAVIMAVSCLFVTGCGCSRVKPSINTNALDRIKIYECNNQGKKGKVVGILKGGAPNAMGSISQMYAEVKTTKEKPKEDTSKAKKVIYFELLNYTDEGKPKDSNYVYVYYIGKKVYCYYKDEQSFGDGDYYLNGYTNVKQSSFDDMIKQAGEK